MKQSGLRYSREMVLFQVEFETQLSHETRKRPFLDNKSMDADCRHVVDLYNKKRENYIGAIAFR